MVTLVTHKIHIGIKYENACAVTGFMAWAPC